MKTTEDFTRPMNPKKRFAILEAATQEFCLAGFDGTSMDRIAEVANVSKTTVYNHFPSKDDLFKAILDELIQKIGDMDTYSYSKDRSLEDQLKAIGQIFADTVTGSDFMKLSRVVISRFIQSPEWGRSAYDQQAKLRKNLMRWIHDGREDGRLNVPDAEMAAAQFCGLIKELVFWPELMWGQKASTKAQRHAAVASAVDVFLAHFKA